MPIRVPHGHAAPMSGPPRCASRRCSGVLKWSTDRRDTYRLEYREHGACATASLKSKLFHKVLTRAYVTPVLLPRLLEYICRGPSLISRPRGSRGTVTRVA